MHIKQKWLDFLHIICNNNMQKGWRDMRKFDYSFLNNGLLPANFVNIDLLTSIKKYHEISKIRKGEYTLLDLLKI